MVHVKNFYFNDFRECCSVIWDETGECVIVDPGCGTEPEKASLYGFISGKGLKPVKILLTHAHFDHILGLADCAGKYACTAGAQHCTSDPVHARPEPLRLQFHFQFCKPDEPCGLYLDDLRDPGR